MIWTALGSLSGLLGLLGVVVGAVVTAAMQARAARQARDAAAHADARDAVRELLAASDILEGLYEAVWQLDDWNHPRPEAAYQRAVEAWVHFQHAAARVRVAAPPEVYAMTKPLGAAHKPEIDAVDVHYQRDPAAHEMSNAEVAGHNDRIHAAQAALLAELNRRVKPARWLRAARPIVHAEPRGAGESRAGA